MKIMKYVFLTFFAFPVGVHIFFSNKPPGPGNFLFFRLSVNMAEAQSTEQPTIEEREPLEPRKQTLTRPDGFLLVEVKPHGQPQPPRWPPDEPPETPLYPSEETAFPAPDAHRETFSPEQAENTPPHREERQEPSMHRLKPETEDAVTRLIDTEEQADVGPVSPPSNVQHSLLPIEDDLQKDMFSAISENDRDLIKQLLSEYDITVFDTVRSLGFHPIHYAGYLNHIEIVFDFVSAGVDINILDINNHNLVSYLEYAHLGNLMMSRLNTFIDLGLFSDLLNLLEEDSEKTPEEQEASKNKKINTLFQLVEHGIVLLERDFSDPELDPNNLREVVFFYAVERNAFETAYKLVQSGVNVDTSNESGQTVFRQSCVMGAINKLFFLYNLGTDSNGYSFDGLSHMHKAIAFSHLRSGPCVSFLISVGADINIPTVERKNSNGKFKKSNNGNGENNNGRKSFYNLGQTPLHFSIRYSQPATAEMLLKEGADPNIPDREGITPAFLLLALAPAYNDNEGWPESWSAETLSADKKQLYNFLNLLIQYNFNVHETDQDGNTLAHIAAQKNLYFLFPLLAKAGTDLNKQNHNGQTSLHMAANHGNLGSIIELLKLDVKTDIEDNNGITPLVPKNISDIMNKMKTLTANGS